MTNNITVLLKRIAQSPLGTFGVIVKDEVPLCVTCEDPWNDNKTGQSCIPTGSYYVIPHIGTKYQNVWRLVDVPGRSAILIHPGNTTDNTEGCILPGMMFGMLKDKPAVLSSQVAMTLLKEQLPERFLLKVT